MVPSIRNQGNKMVWRYCLANCYLFTGHCVVVLENTVSHQIWKLLSLLQGDIVELLQISTSLGISMTSILKNVEHVEIMCIVPKSLIFTCLHSGLCSKWLPAVLIEQAEIVLSSSLLLPWWLVSPISGTRQALQVFVSRHHGLFHGLSCVRINAYSAFQHLRQKQQVCGRLSACFVISSHHEPIL